MTEQLLADNPNLTKEYVCDYSPDLKLALNNTHYWIITIKGKDTFKYREIIKKEGFIWNKYSKYWYKSIDKSLVPEIDKKQQKKSEIEYYNNKGLTYPFCQPKCINKDCNGSKMNQGICSDCYAKKYACGGLNCPGWMSIKCKYNGITEKGQFSCKDCNKDGLLWAEEGRKFHKNGWFGGDNS